MQPYQEATEEISRQGELPLKIAKNAVSAGGAVASAGGGAYLAGGALNRVLPFLSKYIPPDLAMKGLNKIDPRYGSFIKKAMAAGKTFDEVKEFIGSKIEEEGESNKPAKQDRNIIEQYSPNLFQYLKDLIGKGSSPVQAAAKARKFLDKKDQDLISKMEKEHKTDWPSIVQSIFGGQGTAQPQQPDQVNQGAQSGPGQQALMDILSKINQQLGQ